MVVFLMFHSSKTSLSGINTSPESTPSRLTYYDTVKPSVPSHNPIISSADIDVDTIYFKPHVSRCRNTLLAERHFFNSDCLGSTVVGFQLVYVKNEHVSLDLSIVRTRRV
jgi:hypothetical protein